MSTERRAVEPEDVERWRQLYESGESLKTIAEKELRGLQTIKRWLLKDGVSLRQRQISVSDGERQEMADKWLRNVSIEDGSKRNYNSRFTNHVQFTGAVCFTV